jgi:stress-induced-phosphoprotein 1
MHTSKHTQDYDKALATYEAGLKHEPDSQELKDGLMRCLQAIDAMAHGECHDAP